MELKYASFDGKYIAHKNIKNLDCFYFVRYYPVNKYGYMDEQDFIFDFKNGLHSEYFSNVFAFAIFRLFGLTYKDTGKSFLEETIILPVPASTQEKQEKRYKKLFELISEKTGVGNGYEYIKIKNDVEAKHLSNTRTSLEEHIEIDYSFMEHYKNIILIDDIITKGRTISEFADKFRDLECYNKYYPNNSYPFAERHFIVGLTLGKTISASDIADDLFDDAIIEDTNEEKGFIPNEFNKVSSLNPIEVYKNIDQFFYLIEPEDEYSYNTKAKASVIHDKFTELNKEKYL